MNFISSHLRPRIKKSSSSQHLQNPSFLSKIGILINCNNIQKHESKCSAYQRSLLAQNRKMLLMLANRIGDGSRGKIGNGVTRTKEQTSSFTLSLSLCTGMHRAFVSIEKRL